ncbi:MAG: hypothetical protein ABJN11_10340 [Lentilitoribacter sp.]
MKKFEDVLTDIEKMSGLLLKSIKSGADITIESVNWEEERIALKNSADKVKSRPFAEIEKLWNALCEKPAIHVDSELGGSGSSRNQPETILANLPYVEFFKLNRKKHLTFVDDPSHHFGSLKEVDAIEREKIKQALEANSQKETTKEIAQIVVVSGDVVSHSETLEHASGMNGKCLDQGIYEYETATRRFLLVSSSILGEIIPTGTYMIIKGAPPSQEGGVIQILDSEYIFHNTNGLCLLYDCQ